MADIKIDKLIKKYGKNTALNSISLSFDSQCIYGLLGSNGSGKTTLLNIIANRVFATSGTVSVDGHPVQENEYIQGKIFSITEKTNYPTDLKIKDMFHWESKFYPNFDIEYANNLAKQFDLDTNKKLKALSTGYYTILKTVLTLASNVEIMLFDEPVLGIDSLYREVFYDVLVTHHKKNKNLMIIATHLIDEIERVLQKVVIISNGIILKNEEIEKLVPRGKRLNEIYVDILKENRNG